MKQLPQNWDWNGIYSAWCGEPGPSCPEHGAVHVECGGRWCEDSHCTEVVVGLIWRPEIGPAGSEDAHPEVQDQIIRTISSGRKQFEILQCPAGGEYWLFLSFVHCAACGEKVDGMLAEERGSCPRCGNSLD